MSNKLAFMLLAVLAASAMLGACGQKGPLYLPETEQTAAH